MGGICRSPSSPQGRLKLRPRKNSCLSCQRHKPSHADSQIVLWSRPEAAKKAAANLYSLLMRSLAAVNCDLARSATPPEMREQHQCDYPEPLDAESAQGGGAVEIDGINWQGRIGDVRERQPREQDANFVREEGHRNQQAGEQFDEPVFRANERED